LLSVHSSRVAAIGLLAGLCSVASYREVKPFARASTNVLAYVAQYAITLTYACALVIYTEASANGLVLGLILSAVNLAVVALVAGLGAHSYYREVQLRLDMRRRVLTTSESRVVNEIMGDVMPGENFARDGRELEMSESRLYACKVLKQMILNPDSLKVVKRLGMGTFGTVLECTYNGQPVAVKTIKTLNHQNMKTFRAEVLLTYSLRHPNVVTCIGACWSKKLVALVLELVPGGSLGDFLKAPDLRWDEPLLRLATDIARGMLYLHEREYYDEAAGETKRCVIHRDLKVGAVFVLT
jgi:hypothetical protein